MRRILLICFSLLFALPVITQGAQETQETQETQKAPEKTETAHWRITGKHAKANLTCRSCHFSDKPTAPATQAACLECHGAYKGSPESTHDLAVGRRRFKANVHNAHPGQLDCTLCHAAHKIPTLYCNTCHMFKITPK